MSVHVFNPLILPRPEMVTVPAGPFLMGSALYSQPEREVHVREFRIGKYAVTMGEMNRYVGQYAETPFAIFGTKSPYRNLWVGWGKTPQLNARKWKAITRRDSNAANTGEILAMRILKAASSLAVPPVFAVAKGKPLIGALSAYAVFQDWSVSQGFDPFSMLAHLLTEDMGKTKGRFTVLSAIPEKTSWQFRRALFPNQRWAVSVDWMSAYGYARAAGARLPTEAEWEKAARGPQGHDYATASGKLQRGEFDDDSLHRPVGSYPAHGYGLHEMAGDAGEWTMDDYRKGDGGVKVVKACGVEGIVEWHEPEIRLHVARRHGFPVEFPMPGFRLATHRDP